MEWEACDGEVFIQEKRTIYVGYLYHNVTKSLLNSNVEVKQMLHDLLPIKCTQLAWRLSGTVQYLWQQQQSY